MMLKVLDLNLHIPLFITATWLSVLFDVVFLRQVFGFIFLYFLTGMLIVKALRIRKSFLTSAILSVAVSIAVSMVVGLLVNWSLPLMGDPTPLETPNIMIALTFLDLILFSKISFDSNDKSSEFTGKLDKSYILIALIPIMGVLGAILVAHGSNILSLLNFVIIGIAVVLASAKKIPSRSFPLLIFAISISLLLQTTLTNNFLNGWDIQVEYYVAQITQSKQFWDFSAAYSLSPSVNNYNTMLSITVLPTISSNILNIDISWVYKIIFPIVFSIAPVALYLLFEKQVGSRFSLISSFLLLSITAFYQMSFLARQMIAEIFFVLIFFLLLEYEHKKLTKSLAVLLILFAFGIIVSHYSTAFICIYYLLFLTIASYKRINRSLILAFLFLFVDVTLIWYVTVSSSTPLNSLGMIANLSFQEMFTGTSGSSQLLAMTNNAYLVNTFSKVIFIVINAIIALGIIRLITSRKRFPPSYFAICLGGGILLLAAAFVPNLILGLEFARTYQFGLIFSATLAIFGLDFITSGIGRFKSVHLHTKQQINRFAPPILSVMILIFFLFQYGVVTNLAQGVPSNLSLSTDKQQFVDTLNLSPLNAYTYPQDVYGSWWLSNHLLKDSSQAIYCDSTSSSQVLLSYGLINPSRIAVPSYSTNLAQGSIVFLRQVNVEYHLFQDFKYINNATDYQNLIKNTDSVYSNGGSQILYSPTDNK
jgi:uncharacterized membrane protein